MRDCGLDWHTCEPGAASGTVLLPPHGGLPQKPAIVELKGSKSSPYDRIGWAHSQPTARLYDPFPKGASSAAQRALRWTLLIAT